MICQWMMSHPVQKTDQSLPCSIQSASQGEKNLGFSQYDTVISACKLIFLIRAWTDYQILYSRQFKRTDNRPGRSFSLSTNPPMAVRWHDTIDITPGVLIKPSLISSIDTSLITGREINKGLGEFHLYTGAIELMK